MLSILFLFLLIMVFYSTGIVIFSNQRKSQPKIVDSILVVAIWSLFIWSELSGAFDITRLLWLIISLSVGIISQRLFHLGAPEIVLEAAVDNETGLWNKIKEKWLIFSKKLGDFQSRLLLIFFYFIVVTPFALIVRFSRKSILASSDDQSTFWKKKPPIFPN